MLKKSNEDFLTKILAVGVPLITLTVITGPVTDPVNAPKFLVLGALCFAGIGILTGQRSQIAWSRLRIPLIALSLFVLWLVVSATVSPSPFAQNVYGVYGRNTGLLAYLFLAGIFLLSLTLVSLKSFRFIAYGFIASAIANVIYSAWVLAFGDPIGWNNPYGSILGTFGNPNFISSFLGISVAAFLAVSLSSNLSVWIRLVFFFLAAGAGFEISETASIQGYVVAGATIGFVVFSKLWVLKNRIFAWIFLAAAGALSVFAVLGTFQIGPLTKFIYQGTLAFRGQYWLAGINMGNSNPLAGVGTDSYGNYYRMLRDPQALITPGVKVVSNSAHNVVIDFFASGGYPLMLSYVAIVGLALVSFIRVAIRLKKFDLTFVIIGAVWFGYQLQSIISINQIGLAVWGWLSSGCLIAYDLATRESQNREQASEKYGRTGNSKKKTEVFRDRKSVV
jgi:O-antigen ligase